MKKISKAKTLISLVLVAFIATVVGCNHLTRQEPPPAEEETAGQTHYQNFTTVADVVAYQITEKDYIDVHNMFLQMPTESLANVSQVLISKNGYCTEEAIVREYLEHVDIYDNLVPQPTADSITQTVPDTARQIKLRCTEADTVIGGIPYKQLKYQYDGE